MPTRSLASISLIAATAFAVACTPAAAVAGPAPTQSYAAAPKKKTKKKGRKAPAKKPAVLTATVNTSFSLKRVEEHGFGNDGGPMWQKLSVEVKSAKIPFKGDWRESAAADATVTWTYEAQASTDDRSWHLGCDSELRESKATWTGKASVGLRKSTWRQTNGKSKRQHGWEVLVSQPDAGLPVVSSGWFQDWESIAMQNCITTPTTDQLGSFSASFAQPTAMGSLNDDRTSVLLVHSDTLEGETATTSGTIKFSEKLPN